jgi:hypothetical protein
MCRSFKKTPCYVRRNQIAHPKSESFYMYGSWIDLSEPPETRVLKREVYTDHQDGLKKHGKFLAVKEGKSESWICPKHNTARYNHCDHAEKFEKYKPCKTNIKRQLTIINVEESYDDDEDFLFNFQY